LTAGGLRSKSWDEFATPDAPRMDFVFTVCDDAAGEVCPIWPGHPVTAHWGVADPAAVTGSDEDKRRAFLTAFTTLRNRIQLFVNLTLERQDRAALEQRLGQLEIARFRSG
jgi:arsenate reductase